jgi:hypothetical protein
MSIDYDDTTGLFDRWLSPWRGCRQRIEHHGPRELPIDQQLDAVRRRDARIRELNAPPVVGDLLPGPIAAPEPVPALTPRERATAFLRDLLGKGPVAALEVQRLAANRRSTRELCGVAPRQSALSTSEIATCHGRGC